MTDCALQADADMARLTADVLAPFGLAPAIDGHGGWCFRIGSTVHAGFGRRPTHRELVAGHEPLALSTHAHPGGRLIVARLAVPAAHRRRGVGRAIVDRIVLPIARRVGVVAIDAEGVDQDDGAAVAFWTAAGFVWSDRDVPYGVMTRRP